MGDGRGCSRRRRRNRGGLRLGRRQWRARRGRVGLVDERRDDSNQRYSTLDEIDTSNVAQLKGVWRTHLKGSGVAAKYSGESQPIVQDGVIYITTGNDDVFAVSVDIGKILWEHKSNISQEISTICCGWLNRGVGIGDGRLYLGQLDGKVVALDPNTGEHGLDAASSSRGSRAR